MKCERWTKTSNKPTEGQCTSCTARAEGGRGFQALAAASQAAYSSSSPWVLYRHRLEFKRQVLRVYRTIEPNRRTKCNLDVAFDGRGTCFPI